MIYFPTVQLRDAGQSVICEIDTPQPQLFSFPSLLQK